MINFKKRISRRAKLRGTVSGGGSFIPTYMGDYTVIPKVEKKTVLQTKGKKMTDNVTVSKMPIYEIQNESDGITLIIGDEYYGS